MATVALGTRAVHENFVNAGSKETSFAGEIVLRMSVGSIEIFVSRLACSVIFACGCMDRIIVN